MSKSKKDKKQEKPEAKATTAEAEPRVAVINRARFEVFVEADHAIEVEQDGEPVEAKTIMLPGTPRFSLTPKTTIFKLSDWQELEKIRAVRGMMELGQIEVR